MSRPADFNLIRRKPGESLDDFIVRCKYLALANGGSIVTVRRDFPELPVDNGPDSDIVPPIGGPW